MSRVRVQQFAGPDVQDTRENGHEHALVVVGAQFVVDVGEDARCRTVIGGSRFDHRLGHGHKQCRRHALTRYVADAKAEPLLVDEIVIVKIASDLTGRFERRKDRELSVIGEGRKNQRYHAHLNFPADIQLVLHSVSLILDDPVGLL